MKANLTEEKKGSSFSKSSSNFINIDLKKVDSDI
jgi:hypothetical protein